MPIIHAETKLTLAEWLHSNDPFNVHGYWAATHFYSATFVELFA